MNKQMLVAFTILLLALATTGITYSHWIDTARVQTTANMAELKIYIQDHNTTLTPQMSPGNHTLELNGPITPGQTIWTGIIIKNNGTTPASITYGITPDNQPIWDAYFTHNEYFYGPYLTNPPPEVWNHSPTLPPPGGISTPPELLAQNKLVAWQSITLDINCPPDAFTTIEITVAYTATFSTWTDTVSVIYTLTFQP
jgi:hypothetical protein